MRLTARPFLSVTQSFAGGENPFVTPLSPLEEDQYVGSVSIQTKLLSGSFSPQAILVFESFL